MARIIFNLEDGTEIGTELDADSITIGRHPESTVVLACPSVSSHHATIKRRGDAFFVQDLGATNGTKLNGVEVEEARLEDGDRLSFGDIPAVFQLSDPALRQRIPDPVAPNIPQKPAVFNPRSKVKQHPPKPGFRHGVRRGSTAATYSQSSGCAGFIAMLIFLSVAFVAGLFIRHWAVHERFLLTDAVQVIRTKYFANDAATSSEGAEKSSTNDSGAGSKSPKN